MSAPDNCPDCGASLQGEPIPQEYIDKGYYSPGVTHYRREVGHEVPGVYDGTLYWVCPDCSFAWPRRFAIEEMDRLSLQYAAGHNRRAGEAS